MSTDNPTAPVAPTAPTAPTAPEVPSSENAEESTSTRGRKKQNKKEFRTKDDPKLVEWPSDFDPRIHKPLQVEDFEKEDVFWDRKAADYLKRAEDCKKNAELFRKFGSGEKRKAAKKAKTMTENLLGLLTELQNEGISPDDIDLDLETLMKLGEVVGKEVASAPEPSA